MTNVHVQRCSWVGETDLERAYHDDEWGVPVHDDRRLFECLTLEGAQAGLSWTTILRKRENYRRAFAGFDPAAVAAFTETDVEELLTNEGLVRHRGKIESTITNARAVIDAQDAFGSFAAYVWDFVDGSPVQNTWREIGQLPAATDTSKRLSKDLKRRGFRFVGPTTCYAFMQAVGMVNDHVTGCFRHDALRR